jgi:short-chain fatty acids transporter
MMTTVKGFGGQSVADQLVHFFVSFTTANTFPVIMGIYSAVLGFFIPSGGGKRIIELPYVVQAAIDLKVHLGSLRRFGHAARDHRLTFGPDSERAGG